MLATFSIKSLTSNKVTKMKWEVQLYVGGKVFKEEVYANSPKDARETAQARNPTAKVVGVNATFK
jgi:hypothetical protein